jgi:hypothetical protein
MGDLLIHGAEKLSSVTENLTQIFYSAGDFLFNIRTLFYNGAVDHT